MKKYLGFTLVFVILVSVLSPIYAHVAVDPETVGIAMQQNFTATVPNEKDDPTVEVRLVIPDGVEDVIPFVKQGWTVTVKKPDGKVTEIDWAGGSIPKGQKDQFTFSAQVPAQESTLTWKAYQKYQNGIVISWDQIVDPKMSHEDREKMEESGKGPASQTKIINDLKNTASAKSTGMAKNDVDLWIPYIALFLSASALFVSLRKK